MAMLAFLSVTPAHGAGQVLSNAMFLIAAGDDGITDLRRQDDAFDTSYIAQGRALGADVTVRYRESASDDSVSYTHLTLPTNREV